MRRLLLAFILIVGSLYSNQVAAQALLVTPSDVFTYTAPLDSLTQVYPELDGYAVNNSGHADTIYWKLLNATIDSSWLGMSFCDPTNCYYFSTGSVSYSMHHFPADTGVSYRLQFNSTPSCVADSGELQVLMWLQHDSAASATILSYKSLFTGACGAAAITHVASSEIRMYPTPVNSQLTIEGLNNISNPGIYVYDMIGNVVIHKEVNSSQAALTLNTSTLRAGVYMVRIESNGTRVITRRIEKLE